MEHAIGRRSFPTLAAAALVLCGMATPAAAALTGGARLAAVYDTILSAKFADADTELAHACPPAPAEACDTMRVVAAWWEILLDADSRALDTRFQALADAAIAGNEAWTRREPDRAEAWFYLAASYAPLVQWDVLRGERLAAARKGKAIKDALERCLQLDPSITDAHFGIGLYRYYADVAPAAAKILRFLLFLPGGNRVQGLRDMLEVRDHGELLRGEAEYQLQIIDLWYEHQPGKAIDILEKLDARYSTNPLFLRDIAGIYDTYFHDHPASASTWQTLLDRARAGRVYDTARSEVRARMGLAEELDAMDETDRAVDELTAALRAPDAAMPYGGRARAERMLGEAQDRLGRHDLAERAYAAALAAVPPDDPRQTRARVREAQRRAVDPREAESYRLSLEGWRTFERGDSNAAVATLARAAGLWPGDTMTRYRYAHVLASRGDTAHAREQLDDIIAARPAAPPIVLASAFDDYGHLLERAGDHARALTMYRYAIAIVGGDPRAARDAARAIKRLTPGGPS